MDDKELKVMKSKVLAAAEKCGTAREVLKEVFPEAFEDEWEDITEEVEVHTPGCFETPHLQFNDDFPFKVVMSDQQSAKIGRYKIQDGKLWKKRA